MLVGIWYRIVQERTSFARECDCPDTALQSPNTMPLTTPVLFPRSYVIPAPALSAGGNLYGNHSLSERTPWSQISLSFISLDAWILTKWSYKGIKLTGPDRASDVATGCVWTWSVPSTTTTSVKPAGISSGTVSSTGSAPAQSNVVDGGNNTGDDNELVLPTCG